MPIHAKICTRVEQSVGSGTVTMQLVAPVLSTYNQVSDIGSELRHTHCVTLVSIRMVLGRSKLYTDNCMQNVHG